MTGFTGRKNHGRGHSYWIDGAKVQGVTTIINGGLPKAALVNWAARQAAELAVDQWDALAALTPSAPLARISKAHEASRSKAAVRGTRIHALAEPLSRGEEVAVPDELAGHVESCVRFLDDFGVRTLLTEFPVLSRRWRYGGTGDLAAVLEALGDEATWLLDWKTSASGAYGDTAFQLAAYGHAEFTLGPGGEEVPLPAFDRYGVVWLRADGYDLYPYEAGDEVFRQFLYIQQCAKAAEDARDYKGDALAPPVRAAR
jgi:hypothetical protein